MVPLPSPLGAVGAGPASRIPKGMTMTDMTTIEIPERIARIIAGMEEAGTPINLGRALVTAHIDAVLEFATEVAQISNWVSDQAPELARELGVGGGDEGDPGDLASSDEPELPLDQVTETA
jgi:hypothetical protein